MHTHFFAALLLVVGLAAPAQSTAATAEEHALVGELGWKLMVCSTLASYAGKTDEARELFQLGYKTTSAFAVAFLAREVHVEHVASTLPFGAWARLAGPSPEFISGRLFEAAQTESLSRIQELPMSTEEFRRRKVAAAEEFSAALCQSLLPRR
jgi:hypothetical protein